MKRYLVLGLVMGIVAGSIGTANGHSGDQLYPIWQLSDEEVAAIDLMDGSIDDWLDVVGAPVLTTSMFLGPYNPEDLDFRIWLAWHEGTDRIYVAVERVDDRYIFLDSIFNCPSPMCHDAAISLYIDGDHSGGDFMFPQGYFDTKEEYEFYDFQQAQWFTAYAEDLEGSPRVDAWYLNQDFRTQRWFTELPFAGVGGGMFGEDPTVSVVEFFVTPFDRLIRKEPGESVVSDLRAGKIIGFSVVIFDNDHEPKAPADDGYGIGRGSPSSADSFVDGILLGIEGEIPEDTAVRDATWARIKASFGE